MRFVNPLLLSIPVLALALSHAKDASACGGCAMTQDGGFSSTLGALSVLAALALVRRRRSR